MYSLLVSIVLLGALSSALAQDNCQARTYCGNICCAESKSDFANNRTECCRNSISCCARSNPDASVNMVCGDRNCPRGLPQAEVYDNNDQIRDQCCLYFRSGCCSQSENDTLDLLYKLAIGLSCGIGLLLIIIVVLMVCCMFWFCCN